MRAKTEKDRKLEPIGFWGGSESKKKNDSPDCVFVGRKTGHLLPWSWLISFELCFFFFISQINLNAVRFISVEDQIKSSSIWLMMMVFMSAVYERRRSGAGRFPIAWDFNCGTPWKWYILSVCERTRTLPPVVSNLLQFFFNSLLWPFLKVRLIPSSIRLPSVLRRDFRGPSPSAPRFPRCFYISLTPSLSKSISSVSCKCSVWVVT